MKTLKEAANGKNTKDVRRKSDHNYIVRNRGILNSKLKLNSKKSILSCELEKICVFDKGVLFKKLLKQSRFHNE